MEAERLLLVLDSVVGAIRAHDLQARLAQVEGTFQQSVVNPNPDTASAYERTLEAALEAIRQTGTERLSPGRYRMLEKLGGAGYIGAALEAQLKDILSTAGSPATALVRLQTFRTHMDAFVATAGNLVSGLQTIGLRPPELPSDAAEVEVGIPIDMVDSELVIFSQELNKIQRALADIVEVTTGERTPIVLNGTGTGSFEIYLTIDPNSGAAILNFLAALVMLMVEVKKARQASATLTSQEAPAAVLADLQKWESERIDKELARIADALHDDSPMSDKGRKAEMKTALRKSLRFLADRIDRGMDLDVQPPPESPEGLSTDGNSSNTESSSSEALRTIRDRSGTIRSLLRNHEPVLRLPPGEEPGTPETTDQAEKKPKAKEKK